MSNGNRTVPPVPYKVPMTDDGGFLSASWSAWFRQVFLRVGGSVALSNAELENASATNVASVQAQVTSLQNQMSDLGQGRQL